MLARSLGRSGRYGETNIALSRSEPRNLETGYRVVKQDNLVTEATRLLDCFLHLAATLLLMQTVSSIDGRLTAQE